MGGGGNPLLEIFLGKVYLWINPKSNSEILPTEKVAEFHIDPITRKIIESIDPNKIIIVNRDRQELPFIFQSLCSDNGVKYIDLSKNLNLMKDNGDDPNEWKVTKKIGHWNNLAHKTVGQEIAIKISNIINKDISKPNDVNEVPSGNGNN